MPSLPGALRLLVEEAKTEKQRRLDERRDREMIARSADEIRERCRTLSGFVREAWHVLEPLTRYVHNWHIDAICAHLEAITGGGFNRLMINQPPGTMKSLVASVFWQAWEWGPANLPGLRYLTTSYVDTYVRRDCRKARDLVQSEWYRTLWPHVVLERDNEADFENTARGGRRGMPFASLTAGRGNRVIIDDPHSTETVESDAERRTATRIFRESVPSRLNDPVRDAIVVIMHRLHPDDICGVIDRLGLDYVKLILPMEFETGRRCETPVFRDPRQYEGELLFPERFPREALDPEKHTLGSHAYAGQYQQRPTAREGGMFKRHWFQIVPAAPASANRVRRWDLAASVPARGSDPDWSVGLRMAEADRRYYVEDIVRLREAGHRVRLAIRAAATVDRSECKIIIPQDPGQAGKDQAQNIIGDMAGFNIRAVRETGDKATRAEPFAAQCEAGNVFLVQAPWNASFIDELCDFPAGHDDQVDAAAGAFTDLAVKEAFSDLGMIDLDIEGMAGESRWRAPE